MTDEELKLAMLRDATLPLLVRLVLASKLVRQAHDRSAGQMALARKLGRLAEMLAKQLPSRRKLGQRRHTPEWEGVYYAERVQLVMARYRHIENSTQWLSPVMFAVWELNQLAYDQMVKTIRQAA